MSHTGVVFDISHYMLEDGPGIRTNVFLKGCFLKCKWCSNAYGLSNEIQLAYDTAKCIGCGACLNVCVNRAIDWYEKEKKSAQDFSKCNNCLKCVRVCPAKARKQIGRILSAKDVLREVEKDRSFYRRGGGGVTLSGGEILMQSDLAEEILWLCREEGFNTAIETSAFGKWEDLRKILAHTDTAFIDCKCMDEKKHTELTGVSNEIILKNIKEAAAFCNSENIRLIIRLPLIPGLNDSEENIKETAKFADSLPGKPLLNILPYHNFGEKKYAEIGRKYETKDLELYTKEDLERVKSILDKVTDNYSIGGYDI